MNKTRKILVSIFVFMMIILVAGNVNAFLVFAEETTNQFVFTPRIKDGHWTYCVQPGGMYRSSLYSYQYSQYSLGTRRPSSYQCVSCSPGYTPPWDGEKRYMEYTQTGSYNAHNHQDAAYILADAIQRGALSSMDTAYALWDSSVSSPRQSGGGHLSKEAAAYNTFYKQTHNGSSDAFNSRIVDQTNIGAVNVGVNQSNGTYTVGPFKVSYPNGQYNGVNKFSWINSVQAVTDAGTFNAQVLSSGGGVIGGLGKDGSGTINGIEFYIRFSSTSATNVKVQINFGYLESCSAQMLKYTGKHKYRYWERETKSKFHNHPYTATFGKDDPSTPDVDERITLEFDDYKDGYRYVLKERDGAATQTLMALAGTASKNYKTTSQIIAGSGIDLTMEIAGTVFLDQDTGKVNAGNNKLDSGEGLPGIEVYLRGGKEDRVHTDANGNYAFSGLNSQKDYYIEFVYNGMLYTNVERLLGNADNISKATEDVSQYPNTRQHFNNQFAEIGSNPQNYKIRNKVFGNDLGDYNKVYLQEEVADLFREVAKRFGDVSAWKNADIETKRKVQFVVDCRITAHTSVYNESKKTYQIQTYPLIDVFTVDSSWNNIAGQGYNPIYAGAYSQLHVNLGIKARPTFDMALYKDVFNAVLNINGKTETYTYDARKDWKGEGFSFGVNEADYLNEIRKKYISKEPEKISVNLQTKEVVNEGEYSHEYRTEEIINGNNQNTAINDTNLYDENKNYAWRDINHALSDQDKLQIHVTYKLAIRNQSNVVGSVTEIVDYYDSHYQFEKAYVGDKDGNEIPGTKVVASEKSMYGVNTQFVANGEWTVEGEKRSYKTIYLKPTEKKLYSDDKEQYIYITFGLINPEATLVDAGLPNGNKLYTYNLAEINGYKTYGTSEDYKKNPNNTASMGLVDRDSNPGNLNPAAYVMGESPLEDDESKAPAYVYSHRNSRTLEGTVFEDMLSEVSGNKATASKDKNEVKVNTTRFGNGTIDDEDKKVQGVKVELVEIKNGQLIVRQTTYTDKNGWYGFGAFLPGDYTVRFTYGAEDKTALTTSSQYVQGLNDTSYNGQDYEYTTYGVKTGDANTEIRLDTPNYKTDAILISVYQTNYDNRNLEETKGLLSITDITGIDKYTKIKKQEDGTEVEESYYWYAQDDKLSDARDDAYRRDLVTAYSKSEYGKEITNHKAEVFNSYINQNTLREAEAKDKNFDEYTQAQPMDEAVDTEAKNRELVNELERRTYMYAYTPEIEVEVEYTTEQIAGNMASDKYTYKITGVDFGVVERPRAQLTIDQDVKHIKVTASDGSVLFDTEKGVNNLQWIAKGDTSKYDKNELINIILDDELLSGSKLEVTYNITVTNNSEAATGTTRAKTIINYVANNLNFDLADNNGLWEAVKKEEIQTTSRSSYINNSVNKNNVKLVDLSTQTTVLKATTNNPLTKALNPGESATSTLTLKKTLSAESSSDDLSYSNLTEIVEIDNEYGRYDHGAIPGNQSLEEQPREHDTSGSSRYDETDSDSGTKNVKTRYSQDGKIIVTPPTGSKMIYYVLGTTAMLILALGIILIKKFVIRKK